MNLSLREATASDWSAILELAQGALPWDRAGNEIWLEYRRRFTGRRRHYVALGAGNERPFGYGAIEEGTERGNFRIFLVMEPTLLAKDVAALLTQRLFADLLALKATTVWAREYVQDTPLITYLRQLGFTERERITLPGSPEMIVLERAASLPVSLPKGQV